MKRTREQASGLTRSTHLAPLAFDVARPDGSVEHFEIEAKLDPRFVNPVGPDYRYLGPRCCADMERDEDGTCANCGDHQPPQSPFLRTALSPAAEAFADSLRGVRFEKDPDMGETYDVERVFVDGRMVEGIVNRGRKQEPEGQSALPRFSPYNIPAKARAGEVPCPYCVKRPVGAKGLRDHCRAVHPDKPEAR